jgi:hypothetical protein
MTDAPVTETPSVFSDFTFEDIPDPAPRPPGKGREPVKWEEHLAPMEGQLKEKPARLWSYDVKTGAVSRMSAVRQRLVEAAPHKNWEFKVRPIPNSNPSEESPQLYGVYAVFHGDHTPEQVLANAQERQKRREAMAAAKSAKEAAGTPEATPVASSEAPASTEAPKTPKEKLAAAAAAKK